MQLMSARPRRWLALFCLVLAGPTLLLPVQLWHHHGAHGGGHCSLCALAKQTARPPSDLQPPLPETMLALVVPESDSQVRSITPQLPICVRAPPAALRSA